MTKEGIKFLFYARSLEQTKKQRERKREHIKSGLNNIRQK